MGLAVQICEQEPDEKIFKLLPRIHLNHTVYQLLNDMAPAFNETYVLCDRFGQWENCSDIFFESLTERGFCYSFNRINLKEFLNNK